ncbi:MAG: DNA-3-methyladenine glycosylase 2 [Steroidobacteraceae bacterium]|nr:DNA-3-methyladenine glycosylase 2 [Steroidobacteraceae bacterium]
MSFTLSTRAPFHLEATVRVLQRRPANRVDIWDRGRYLRVLPAGQTNVLVQVRNHGTIEEPDLRVDILAGAPPTVLLPALQRTLRHVLGLDVNPEPFQQMAEADARLRPTALALRGMRPPRFADLFESFASVVPFQQVSLDAGVAILGRIVEAFATTLDHAGARFHAFPKAAAIARADVSALRACGLSTSKAQTLQQLARACDSGELDAERISGMTTRDALDALTKLPGIGPWSAALVLLRGLGRLDVFPPGDVGAMRALGALLHFPPGLPLRRAIERFGEWRGYLYFYGLGESLLRKGLIHPVAGERTRGLSAAGT